MVYVVGSLEPITGVELHISTYGEGLWVHHRAATTCGLLVGLYSIDAEHRRTSVVWACSALLQGG